MASASPERRTNAFLKPRAVITVLTFWAFTPYSLLIAWRICFLLARRSTKKERMFSDYENDRSHWTLTSIFFMADSVTTGFLMIA